MTDKSLTVLPPSELSLTVKEVVANVAKVREVLETVMKVSVHYGKVPGTDRMSLWQPGAEVLMLTFRLRPELHVEDLSNGDSVRYRVSTLLIHIPTGEVVGHGFGECSTDEGKYRWRKAVSKEEFEATREDRRRLKYGAGQRGSYTVMQVRTDPADLANTVLKMATKRAIVGTVRSATAASDVFDQDLDELKEAGIELEASQPPIAKPKARPAKPPQASEASTVAQSEDVLAFGLNIPEEAWEEVRQVWPRNNLRYISEQQQKRLFAIAGENGWTGDQVNALLHDRLGDGINMLPIMATYDKVVAIFQSFKPS